MGISCPVNYMFESQDPKQQLATMTSMRELQRLGQGKQDGSGPTYRPATETFHKDTDTLERGAMNKTVTLQPKRLEAKPHLCSADSG